MSKERMTAVYSKLDSFKIGVKVPAGTPKAIGMNQKTGDVIVEMAIEPHKPEEPDVMRYVILPRHEIVRIDGERIEGPTIIEPTGLNLGGLK